MARKTIGVVGGGQLCLMLGEAIVNDKLGYDLIAVDPSQPCPAHSVLKKHIVGDFRDEEKLYELAKEADIVTFEIELANSEALSKVEKEGKPLHPSSAVLKTLQDKFVQAEFLQKHGCPVPGFLAVGTEEEVASAIEELGLPLMIKSRKDSYDGKGNFIIRSKEDIPKALAAFSGAIMAQQFISFDVEVSVMCARGTDGSVVTLPVAENIHGAEYNILQTSIVPARVSEEVKEKAKSIAISAVEALDGVGMFGVELLVAGDDVLINEIAPRVHNTGHYSIEGCDRSQFRLHIEAVAGEKLVTPSLVADSVVMHNLIGMEEGAYTFNYEGKDVEGVVEIEKGAFVHHYGKALSKVQRKLGHMTVVAQENESQEELIKRAQEIFNKVKIVIQ